MVELNKAESTVDRSGDIHHYDENDYHGHDVKQIHMPVDKHGYIDHHYTLTLKKDTEKLSSTGITFCDETRKTEHKSERSTDSSYFHLMI